MAKNTRTDEGGRSDPVGALAGATECRLSAVRVAGREDANRVRVEVTLQPVGQSNEVSDIVDTFLLCGRTASTSGPILYRMGLHPPDDPQMPGVELQVDTSQLHHSTGHDRDLLQ